MSVKRFKRSADVAAAPRDAASAPDPPDDSASDCSEAGDAGDAAAAEQDLVAALVYDHLVDFKEFVKEEQRTVFADATFVADGPLNADQVNAAIRKHGGAAELFDALHEELMRETTEEGRTSVAAAFDNTCRRVYAGVWMLHKLKAARTEADICILAWGGPEHARGLGTAPALDKVVENAEGDVDKWMVAMAHDVAQQLLGEASVPMDDGASTGEGSENDDIVAAGSDIESDGDEESDESGEEGEEGEEGSEWEGEDDGEDDGEEGDPEELLREARELSRATPFD